MKTNTEALSTRFLSAFLIGALCLPPSAQALRPLNAGSEESPVPDQLAARLENTGTVVGTRENQQLAEELHRFSNLFPTLITYLQAVEEVAKTSRPELAGFANNFRVTSSNLVDLAREVMTEVGEDTQSKGLKERVGRLRDEMVRFRELRAHIPLDEIRGLLGNRPADKISEYANRGGEAVDTILVSLESLGLAVGASLSGPAAIAAVSVQLQIEDIVHDAVVVWGGEGTIMFEGIAGVPAGARVFLRSDRWNAVRDTLLELLKNARKYQRPGVRLGVTVSGVYTNGLLTLRVEDNGIGIQPDDQARYGQGGMLVLPDGVTVSERAGIGIRGQREQLEALGGGLELITERTGLGVGTAVRFWLPAEISGGTAAAGAEEKRITVHLSYHAIPNDLEPTAERLRLGKGKRRFYVGEQGSWGLDLLDRYHPALARLMPMGNWPADFEQSAVAGPLRQLVAQEADSPTVTLQRLKDEPSVLNDPQARESLGGYLPLYQELARQPEVTPFFERPSWESAIANFRADHARRQAIGVFFGRKNRDLFFKWMVEHYRWMQKRDALREEVLERDVLRPVFEALRTNPQAELVMQFGGDHQGLKERLLRLTAEYGILSSDLVLVQEDRTPLQVALDPYRQLLLADPPQAFPQDPILRRKVLEDIPDGYLLGALLDSKRVKSSLQAVQRSNSILGSLSGPELDEFFLAAQQRAPYFLRLAQGTFPGFERLLGHFTIAWLHEKGKLEPALVDLNEEFQQITLRGLDESVGYPITAGAEEKAKTRSLPSTWKDSGIRGKLDQVIKDLTVSTRPPVPYRLRYVLHEFLLDVNQHGYKRAPGYSTRLTYRRLSGPDRIEVVVQDQSALYQKATGRSVEAFSLLSRPSVPEGSDETTNQVWRAIVDEHLVLSQQLTGTAREGGIGLRSVRGMIDQRLVQFEESFDPNVGNRYVFTFPVEASIPKPSEISRAAGAEEEYDRYTTGSLTLPVLTNLVVRMAAQMAAKHQTENLQYRFLFNGNEITLPLQLPWEFLKHGAEIATTPGEIGALEEQPSWGPAFLQIYELVDAALREQLQLPAGQNFFVTSRIPRSHYPEQYGGGPVSEISLEFLFQRFDPVSLKERVPLPLPQERLADYVARVCVMYQAVASLDQVPGFHLRFGVADFLILHDLPPEYLAFVLNGLFSVLEMDRPGLSSRPALSQLQQLALVNLKNGSQAVSIRLRDEPPRAAGTEEAGASVPPQLPSQGLEMDGLTVRATGQLLPGLESVLTPGVRAIVVPVANQPEVPLLAVSAGIGELPAYPGVRVERLADPGVSRVFLGANRAALLLVTPEEAEQGDWRGDSGVPMVVLPALAAAGLEQAELAPLAAAARAHGGLLHLNGITRAGMEEQGSVLVLEMV